MLRSNKSDTCTTYLTKYWIGRWWWYKHTKKKYPFRTLPIGRFHVGRISYKILKDDK